MGVFMAVCLGVCVGVCMCTGVYTGVCMGCACRHSRLFSDVLVEPLKPLWPESKLRVLRAAQLLVDFS